MKNLLFITVFLFAIFGNAQISIKNKVVDFSTLMPIESASVYVKNTTTGTVTNADGNFQLQVPEDYARDTLIISSIGYTTFKVPVNEFDESSEVYLEEEIAALDEVLLVAEPRPTTGNEIVLKALRKLSQNLPDSSYMQKGFLRHKERNSIEFKWLIESAITVYDSGYASNSEDYLKINVDQVRKSYDLRDVDSTFSYTTYINRNRARNKIKSKDINLQSIDESEIVKAIRWNDNRVNGLQNLFQGKLNLIRNSNDSINGLFGKNILDNHQFKLDTILVDNERKLYKIDISHGEDFVGLGTKGIFNEGFHSKGSLYIYYDNYAIKKLEYELVAASDAQKSRSKTLFGTQTNHKLIINYIQYEDKMYPSYIYYETPKLVNVGLRSNEKVTQAEMDRYNKEERYYYTVQEILFTEIIVDKDEVVELFNTKKWDSDIFEPKPYDKTFWSTYNILLETDEDKKLIQDLTKKAKLFKD